MAASGKNLRERLSRARGGDPDGSFATPTKKARHDTLASSQGQSASSPGVKSPASSQDRPGIGDDDGGDECGAPPGKQCLACRRVTGTDSSFYCPGQPFAWLYSDGRAGFCKDCGSVYRTVYKMTMCLPTWTTWLQKNRLDYLGILMAYVSLKKEGSGSAAADRIEARREYLKWLFATCGYPFPLGTAMPLLASSQEQVLRLEGGFACASTDSVHPFVLMPRDVSEDASSDVSQAFVTVSQAEIAQPLWPVRLSSSAMERISHPEMKSQLLTSGSELRLKAIEDKKDRPGSSVVAEKNEEPAKFKYRKAINILTESFKEVFEHLGMTTKEADINRVLKKASKLHAELLNTPYAQSNLMTKLLELMKIITIGQKAVRPLREYVKDQKQRHLTALTDLLGPLTQWAKREGEHIMVNGTLVATHVKAKFYKVMQDEGAGAAIREWAKLPSVVAGAPDWANPLFGGVGLCSDCIVYAAVGATCIG